MCTTDRNDCHRPSVIEPQDYQFVGMKYYGTDPYLIANCELDSAHIRTLVEENGYKYGKNHSKGDCYCCGNRPLLVGVYIHIPTKELVRFGHDCAAKVDHGSKKAFSRARKDIDDIRARKAGKAKALLIIEDNGLTAELAPYVDAPYIFPQGIYLRVWGVIRDMVQSLIKYGSWSDKQVDFIKSRIKFLNTLVEEYASPTTEVKNDIADGRYAVTGKVLSIKPHESVYGVTYKMLVEIGEGQKVYGSVPSAILSDVEKGDTVAFTAKFEQKETGFAWYSRPSKASIEEGVGV